MNLEAIHELKEYEEYLQELLPLVLAECDMPEQIVQLIKPTVMSKLQYLGIAETPETYVAIAEMCRTVMQLIGGGMQEDPPRGCPETMQLVLAHSMSTMAVCLEMIPNA